jgi:hypothetical protein
VLERARRDSPVFLSRSAERLPPTPGIIWRSAATSASARRSFGSKCPIALDVLHQRIPDLRVTRKQKLEFVPVVTLQTLISLMVEWD